MVFAENYIFAQITYIMGKFKTYKTREEAAEAFRQAIALRSKWKYAIEHNLYLEEMKKMGVVPLRVGK